MPYLAIVMVCLLFVVIATFKDLYLFFRIAIGLICLAGQGLYALYLAFVPQGEPK